MTTFVEGAAIVWFMLACVALGVVITLCMRDLLLWMRITQTRDEEDEQEQRPQSCPSCGADPAYQDGYYLYDHRAMCRYSHVKSVNAFEADADYIWRDK